MSNRDDAVLAAGFLAVNAAFFPRTFDQIGFINAVLAERPSFAYFEYAHPAYVPALSAIHHLLNLLGIGGPHALAYQLFSLVFATAALALYRRIIEELLGSRLWSWIAALLAGFAPGFWTVAAAQVRPYGAACFFLALTGFLLLKKKGRELEAGISLGLACGFTMACAALVPVIAAAARRRNLRLARCAAGFAAALGAAYLVFFATQHAQALADLSHPAALAAHLSSVPLHGTVRHRPLRHLRKLLELLAGENPGFLWLTPLLVLIPLRRRDRAGRPAALFFTGAFACLFAFFYVVDIFNTFRLALFPMLIPLALAFVPRKTWTAAAAACAAVLLGVRTFAFEVRPRARVDPFVAEGAFLAERVAPLDLIVSIGQPDWRVLYFWRDRLPLVVASGDPTESGPFGIEEIPLDAALARRIDAALRAGRKVILAADTMFQPRDVWSEEEALEHQRDIYEFLSARFVVEAPVKSPSGQHYYPLGLRPR